MMICAGASVGTRQASRAATATALTFMCSPSFRRRMAWRRDYRTVGDGLQDKRAARTAHRAQLRGPSSLLALHLHLPRFHFLDLGHVHGEHAVLALGGDPSGVDRLVYLEDAEEVAFLVLGQKRLPRPLAALDAALQDQLAALEAQVHVLGPDARQVGVHRQFLVGLEDVHAWLVVVAAAGRFGPPGVGHVFGSRIGHGAVSLSCPVTRRERRSCGPWPTRAWRA